MLERIPTSALTRICGVASDVLAKHRVADEIAPEAPDAELARFGMTSIDMVELMLGVEAEFDIAIPAADITLQNFRSVAAIAAMVSRLAVAA